MSEPCLAGARFNQDVCRLQVLVNETSFVKATERGRDPDGQAHGLNQFQRLSEQRIEGYAARVFQQQYRSPLLANQRDRSNRPTRIKFSSQGIFVLEPPQAAQGGRA